MSREVAPHLGLVLRRTVTTVMVRSTNHPPSPFLSQSSLTFVVTAFGDIDQTEASSARARTTNQTLHRTAGDSR